MNYFKIAVFLPVFVQAMDIEAIKKYSSDKVQPILTKQSLSEQDRKDIFHSWFTLSLMPFLEHKQQNNQGSMKDDINSIAFELDFLLEKKIIKNPFIIRDNRNEYPIDLQEEAKRYNAILCINVFVKHNPDFPNQPMELVNQLFDMKKSTGESILQPDVYSKSIANLRSTESLFLTMAKMPEPELVSSGYDSIG